VKTAIFSNSMQVKLLQRHKLDGHGSVIKKTHFLVSKSIKKHTTNLVVALLTAVIQG